MSAITFVAQTLRRNFLFRLYKYYVIDSILIIKEFGCKALLRRRGLKFVLVIVAYYLVRDTVLYILIPYGVAHRLLGLP
ncbi:MAG: hypothetical protein ALAOOOJD_04724 [bacterium]|nr:hypothetical protein [bacterium]